MDRTAFEAELNREGYEIVTNTMAPNKLNDEHAHSFDAYLLVTAGQMTIAANGERHTYQTGETFRMPAGCRHSETAGPEGATYIAGRRHKAA
jgi:quercetin dioxygenase-like cupin family protein